MQPLFRDSAQLNCPLIPFAALPAALPTPFRPLSFFLLSARPSFFPDNLYTRGSAFHPQILMETFKQYGTNTGK